MVNKNMSIEYIIKKKRNEEVIEYKGNSYYNEPTTRYTKVGRKPEYVKSLPEYKDTQGLLIEIDLANQRIPKLKKWIDETHKTDYDELTKLHKELTYHEMKLEENTKEMEKRLIPAFDVILGAIHDKLLENGLDCNVFDGYAIKRFSVDFIDDLTIEQLQKAYEEFIPKEIQAEYDLDFFTKNELEKIKTHLIQAFIDWRKSGGLLFEDNLQWLKDEGYLDVKMFPNLGHITIIDERGKKWYITQRDLLDELLIKDHGLYKYIFSPSDY